MSIFKRKKQPEPQSGPKVFTPEDYARLMAEGTPAPETAPQAPTEPETPSFDSISPNALSDTNQAEIPAEEGVPQEIPTAEGLQLTEDHPEKTIPVSPNHDEKKVDPIALEAALMETSGSSKPRRVSPFESDEPAAEAPGPAPEPIEPPPMPTVETTATPAPSDLPTADSTPIPISVNTEASPTPNPEPETSQPAPEATAESMAPLDPTPTNPALSPSEVQDLAKRVSQALVDLEELRVQKEQLEQSLQELRTKHSELENKIEQQRKIATELLDQVHQAL